MRHPLDCRHAAAISNFDEDGSDYEAEDAVFDGAELELDANGIPTELVRLGGQDVLVHYEDIPDGDITSVNGIRCTTALRTVIDIAPDVEPQHLERIVADALDRQLFTVEEARARLAESDMAVRPGAVLLREVLNLTRS